MTVSQEIYKRNLSFSSISALDELAKIVSANRRNNIIGTIIEAGCALGGSAIVIASAKSLETSFLIYDTFNMIPAPSDKDGQDVHAFYKKMKAGNAPGIRGSKYYAYVDNLYQKVRSTFLEFGLELFSNNITLIRGDIRDTMAIDFPISFAHLDCDWYESVMFCLQRIWPCLVIGGTLVIDDYNAWSGCKKAVTDFFVLQDKKSFNFVKKSRLHIIKN